MYNRSSIALLATALFAVSLCPAADWPQFRGLRRDGKSDETGLLKKWPEAGPKQLWSVAGLGAGFSSAAIADGLVYITGKIGPTGYIFCFDLNGQPQW
ncbi:MAG: PQQ-binding-like beta-propeller repeat protein, partial [Sedimentisphaerales bacterium]|nr:PQQ-binding-like beta-propeller repeat protein [Sedimentisphaerales bacterium]